MMKMQQSIQVRDRHCSELNDDHSQQVNCKGDKIENIGQLLMHLGMGDIKDKCDGCDIEVRKACLEKQSKTVPVKLDKKIANEKTLADGQCAERQLFQNRWPDNRKRAVENTFILSSIFASILVVAITF